MQKGCNLSADRMQKECNQGAKATENTGARVPRVSAKANKTRSEGWDVFERKAEYNTGPRPVSKVCSAQEKIYFASLAFKTARSIMPSVM